MIESENTRLFQTKINYLLNDSNQLRNENLNLQKLIKLQHSKQTTLDQIVLLQCQQNDENNCDCSKIYKTNEILVKLFRKTIEENKRLVGLIQNIQKERDEALSKALINEQIAEGLEFEEMELIQSLNEQILRLQATTKQQSDEIVELRQFSGMESPSKTGNSKMEDKKVTGKTIELNSLLEKSIEQLNKKTTQASALEEQKKELIFLNSLLTAEIKQLRTSSHKDVNLGRIISEQTKLFNDVELTDSSSGNSSYLGEELPNKVNFKKQENNNNTHTLSPQNNLSNANMQKPLKDSVRNNLPQGITFKNMSQIGGFSSEIHVEILPGGNIILPGGNIILPGGKIILPGGNIIQLNQNKNNSNFEINHSNVLVLPQEMNVGSSDQLIPPKPSNNSQQNIVPKLDLTKAVKMQQITFKSQLKQEFQKHQMLLQNKIEHKQKQLEKKRLEKGITEQQASQIQQEILQLEEQKLDRSQMLVEENIQLQEKINKLNTSLESAYFQICQEQRHTDQLQRDLNQALENNSLLIDSNLQYEKRWSKIATSFQFFRKYYHQSLLQGHNLTTNTGNTLRNANDMTFPLQLNSVPSKPSSFTNRQTHISQNHYAHMIVPPTSASQNFPLSTKSSRVKLFHPSQLQFDQFGQKTFEESDVDNTVFVPLSLRKQSCKKLHKQFHGDSEQIEPFSGQESELRGDERLSADGEQQIPYFKDVADDISLIPSSSPLAEPRNLEEGKVMIYKFAQEIYLNKELTRITRSSQYYDSVKPKDLFINLQRTIQEKVNKATIRQKARSVSPKQETASSTLKILPFKLLAKYKNVQALRVFQTKTMSMYNNQKNQKNNKQACISNNQKVSNQKRQISQSFSSIQKFPLTLDS